jgi:hypothetical protein
VVAVEKRLLAGIRDVGHLCRLAPLSIRIRPSFDWEMAVQKSCHRGWQHRSGCTSGAWLWLIQYRSIYALRTRAERAARTTTSCLQLPFGATWWQQAGIESARGLP